MSAQLLWDGTSYMFHTNQACAVKPCAVTILWIPKGAHLPQKKGRVFFPYMGLDICAAPKGIIFLLFW